MFLHIILQGYTNSRMLICVLTLNYCIVLAHLVFRLLQFPLLKPNNLRVVKHQVLSRISLPRALRDGGDWTLVTPRRRKRGRGQGPKVPSPPYFRMPFHLWPPSIQQKYPQGTSSASSASSEVSEDENSRPIASRTRARTMQ